MLVSVKNFLMRLALKVGASRASDGRSAITRTAGIVLTPARLTLPEIY